MKQRIFSLFTALCLCLTLLPTAAFAEENGICTHTSATQQSDGSYICANEECGETLIAEVTSTTATYYLAKIGVTEPNSAADDDLDLIQNAFLNPYTNAVKLLADVATTENGATITFYYPNQTLDLNGHTLDTRGAGIALMSSGSGNPVPSVTITDSSTDKNGELKATVLIDVGSLTVNSGTLTALDALEVSSLASLYAAPQDTGLTPGPITIEGGSMTISGTATVDCSTITVVGSESNRPSSLTVQGDAQITGGIAVNQNGTLTMTGGTVKMRQSASDPSFNPLDNSVKVYVSGGTAKISGGSIDDGLVVTGGSVELSGGTYKGVSAYSGSAVDLLKNGYAYFTKAEGSEDYTLTKPTTVDQVSMVENVAVQTHECSFVRDDDAKRDRFVCGCGRTATQQPIAYVDENGDTAYCMEYTELDESYVENHTSENSHDFTVGEQGTDSWYVVKKDLTVNGKMNIEGYYAGLHLILCNGATLTVEGISGSETNSMTTYGQRGGTGKLVTNDLTTGGRGYGIQVSNGLTINGGVIEAAAPNAEFGYGIYVYGDLTVNGGTVTATGGKTTVAENETTGKKYYGIYVNEGDVTVNGGTVTATGGEIKGEDIDGESCGVYVYGNDGTTLTVNGGTLTATGGDTAVNGDLSTSYGLYLDSYSEDGYYDADMFMTGGTLTATGGKVTGDRGDSANYLGESCGIYIEASNNTSLTVTGGKLTATGGTVEASGTGTRPTKDVYGKSYGIYFDGGYDDELTVSGGTVKATGGSVSLTRTADSDPDDHAESFAIYGEDVQLSAPGTMELSTGTVSMNYSTEPAEGERGYASAYDLYIDKLTVSGSALKLKESYLGSPITVSGSVKLADLLADGYAYWQEGDETGSFLKLADLTNATALNAENTVYYIDLCTHSTSTGVCAYCGKDFTPKPSTGGGSSSNTTSTTVKNPDGSTTTTVTDKKTGTVTETTKNTDGSTTTIETKKDGTVTETTTTPNGTTSTTVTDKNGNSTTTVSVSKKDAQSGETVTLPVDEVKAADSSENATEISVEVPSGGATVEIPVKNPTPGTVIVVVDKDGNETVIPGSKVTENGIEVKLTEDATIKVIENSKDFSDVKSGDYFSKPVQWASARNITGGVDENHFGPDLSCTRAQLVTFLWRAAGCPVVNYAMSFTDVGDDYYTEAVRWAASIGIVDGYGNGQFGSEDTITREQMATILYRFAQTMGMDTTQGGMAVREYKDFDSISDYAVTAIQWAVNAGIMQGDDGNLMPGQPCTRAQIVTMLYRLLGE